MKHRKLLNEEKLNKLYNQEKCSLRKVAVHFECSTQCVTNNLKWFGYNVRDMSEARLGKFPWNKGLTKETNKSLMSISEKNSRNQKGRTSSNKGKIRNNKILIKIVEKQLTISTDYNLNAFGYRKITKRKNGAIDWVLKDEANKKVRDKRKANPEKFKEYGRRNYQRHKQANIERAKRYSKTEKGGISRAKQKYKHNQKGFIPLNKSLRILSDWHHLHSQLPFVLSIDRKIHRKYNGKIHYDSVNAEIGLTELVGKSKEDIEYYIEVNYPEEFKKYWFGEY